MPDWTYQTIFRPALFRMPADRARQLALGVMGRLARLPSGHRVIEFFGHMRPHPSLARHYAGCDFPTPVGLGLGVDFELAGLPALSRFGFGFVELGPVHLQAEVHQTLERDDATQSIRWQPPSTGPSLDTLMARLEQLPEIPLLLRLRCDGCADFDEVRSRIADLMQRTRKIAKCYVLDTLGTAQRLSWNQMQWADHIRDAVQTAGVAAVLLALPANVEWDAQRIETADGQGIRGLVIGPSERDGCFEVGSRWHAAAIRQVQQVRQLLGPGPLVIASAGVHEPAQALALKAAGADLVQVDSGLVFTGPGLPKRVNEAILWSERLVHRADGDDETAPRRTWFWTMLMGVSMFFGGVLALLVAVTRVVLPYDEAMVGMSRDQILQLNPRLLAFMTHDRVTLSGTMLSVGVLYCALSWFAIRLGSHWARRSVVVSAFAGFFSFFLFLGFGYFDPFHAFVTAVLFQFLLFAMYAHLGTPQISPWPDLHNDWRWKLSQWGQLVFVLHGALIIVAGLVICSIGITSVFVPSDLEFMDVTSQHLHSVPQLVPLVAHDRATFGGMLIACGVVVLLPALWGYRRGERWLWWALQVAGSIAYLSTIFVHHGVGYVHLGHLMPAYGGFAALQLGSFLSYPFLCDRPPVE